MNEISKFFALTVVAAVVMGATMTANGEKTYGTVDRNIGSGNLGQQNCADAETTNPNNGAASERENGGNFVGGDLNISSGD
jgi:hypothetical protein